MFFISGFKIPNEIRVSEYFEIKYAQKQSSCLYRRMVLNTACIIILIYRVKLL